MVTHKLPLISKNGSPASNGKHVSARAAAKLGYSNRPAVSRTGHDAVYMAKLAPSGMIFIPCKGRDLNCWV